MKQDVNSLCLDEQIADEDKRKQGGEYRVKP